MRTAINLAAIAATAAFMALAASPASAGQLEVIDEVSGEHCPDTVDLDEHAVAGGCEVLVLSEHDEPSELRQHVPGMGEVIFSTCDNEFVAHLNEDGVGFLDELVLTPSEVGTCVVEPCDEYTVATPHPNIPWPIHLYEFGGQKSVDVTFCLRFINPNQEGLEAAQAPCTLAVPFDDDDPPNHEYEARTNPLATSSRCSQNPAVSVDGHWDVGTESPNTIEVEHGDAP